MITAKTYVMMATAIFIAACGTTRIHENQKETDLEKLNNQLSKCTRILTDTKSMITDVDKKISSEEMKFDRVEQRMKAYREIAEMLQAAFNPDLPYRLEIRDGMLVLNIPEEVIFDLSKAELTKSGTEALRQIAPVLRQIKNRDFLIAGYTDNVPVKPKSKAYSSNWELSQKRALAVLEFLTKMEVYPQSIAAVGFGKYHPISSNDTEEGRAENRRTEIIFMPTIEELPKMPNEVISNTISRGEENSKD